MGKVYFHSPSEKVLLQGSERHYAGQIVNRLACAVLPPDSLQNSILHLLPPDCYLRGSRQIGHFKEHFPTWMQFGDGNFHLPAGERVSAFVVSLNTAIVLGSRPVKLLARIHGQCEIHAWVDGPNRAWLADIIEEGRKSGILRADRGWEGVVELLHQRDDEAVVTSYSVCEQFPSPPESWEYRDEDEEEGYFGPDGQMWHAMNHEEQWKAAMGELRERSGNLELEPDGFDDFWFGDNKERITMFDIDRMGQEATEQESRRI